MPPLALARAVLRDGPREAAPDALTERCVCVRSRGRVYEAWLGFHCKRVRAQHNKHAARDKCWSTCGSGRLHGSGNEPTRRGDGHQAASPPPRRAVHIVGKGGSPPTPAGHDHPRGPHSWHSALSQNRETCCRYTRVPPVPKWNWRCRADRCVKCSAEQVQ